MRLSVKENTPIVKNWSKFLKEDSNKTELFNVIAEKITAKRYDGKVVIATKGNDILGAVNEENITPCNHEEADTGIYLHVKHISEAGHQKVSIKSVDTDVVVIAISLFRRLGLQELWVEFGNGIHTRWLLIHDYALNLGENVCQALPVWFSFTGCDTVSAFSGRGKRIAWKTLKSYTIAVDTFKRQDNVLYSYFHIYYSTDWLLKQKLNFQTSIL